MKSVGDAEAAHENALLSIDNFFVTVYFVHKTPEI
jgi:hypothetical protein